MAQYRAAETDVPRLVEWDVTLPEATSRATCCRFTTRAGTAGRTNTPSTAFRGSPGTRWVLIEDFTVIGEPGGALDRFAAPIAAALGNTGSTCSSPESTGRPSATIPTAARPGCESPAPGCLLRRLVIAATNELDSAWIRGRRTVGAVGAWAVQIWVGNETGRVGPVRDVTGGQRTRLLQGSGGRSEHLLIPPLASGSTSTPPQPASMTCRGSAG
jgi:hypothetical protein